jgi:iron(III) transport system ATP-binding protein
VRKLAIRDLTRRFGEALAVDHFDLELDEGEFVALLGPSGCGKTTTLRLIAGFDEPDAGTIEMDATVLSSPGGVVPPERRHMSMIFQSYAVWPNMTVEDNVAFGLNLRHLPREEVRERVREMLEVVHMDHLAQRYPAELSGGQQQRVALARAIVIRPQVLLLDEPLSNLDAHMREEMRAEIRRLHDAFRTTTVYVTHDQSEAMVTADRIVVMNQGRIEQVDNPLSLYTRPRTRFVAQFVGRTNFIDGACHDQEIVFERFRIARSALPGGAALAGKVTFSVRPQSLRLTRDAPPHNGASPHLEVTIVERAYLGEYWDYSTASVAGAMRLRVNAPPSDIYEVGDVLWLELDPAQMTAVI